MDGSPWRGKIAADQPGARAIPFEIPIAIGRFRVDNAGRLEPIETGSAPGFQFDWRGRALHASMDGACVRLEGTLGRVPSSAARGAGESAGPVSPDPDGRMGGRREHAFALLRGLPASMPPGWALTLTPDHGVRLCVTQPTSGPLTASDLMTAVTGLLLTLGSYLDLLDEAGIG